MRRADLSVDPGAFRSSVVIRVIRAVLPLIATRNRLPRWCSDRTLVTARALAE